MSFFVVKKRSTLVLRIPAQDFNSAIMSAWSTVSKAALRPNIIKMAQVLESAACSKSFFSLKMTDSML